MADPELVRILREERVEAWNAFACEARKADKFWRANLVKADLGGADLHCVDLWKSDLCEAKLNGARLGAAQLNGAELRRSDLSDANFREASLRGARFSGADLTGCVLRRADLSGATFRNAVLRQADLRDAELLRTDLSANLDGADFAGAQIGYATFQWSDLSRANGLCSVFIHGPVEIGRITLQRSRGKIPDAFLKGCGFQDWEILDARLYDPDLSDDRRIDIAYQVAAMSAKAPIQPSPVFISYTHADSLFVDRILAALDERSIRSWRDIHDAEAGPLEKVIDRAIALNPTMILVLSRASVNSNWVEFEVQKAIELEKELDRDVLCPITLDDAWRRCRWPGWLRKKLEAYTILDYSAEDAVEKQRPRLLKGLHIHYRGEGGAGGG